MSEHIDDEDGLSYLESLDSESGINKPVDLKPAQDEMVEKKEPIKSLGKARTYESSELSGAEESPWKILNLDLLPSRGMFYPVGAELLIRSAKTKEIRHWSTMDEHDPIDVEEKINFVLNACTRFKIKGNPQPFNFNDFLLVDRYHILFRIYELTFPNQENKLMANIRCENPKCKHVNKIQVTSRNLNGFEIPENYMRWYSEEERCFVVPSEKLQETLKFYIPTAGINAMLKKRRKFEEGRGAESDPSFYSMAPYILSNWRTTRPENIGELKIESNSWSNDKFNAIYRFTEDFKKSSLNRASGVCEKCKEPMESHIFLGGSFTVKDIFIISAGFDELI
jgi:hypothetical protein